MSESLVQARHLPGSYRPPSPPCMYSGLMGGAKLPEQRPLPAPLTKAQVAKLKPPATTTTQKARSLGSKSPTSSSIFGTLRRNITPSRSMELVFIKRVGNEKRQGKEDKKGKSVDRQHSSTKSTSEVFKSSIGTQTDVSELKHGQSFELRSMSSRMTLQSSSATSSLSIPHGEASSDNGSFSASYSSSNISSSPPVLPRITIAPGSEANRILGSKSGSLILSPPVTSLHMNLDATTPTQSTLGSPLWERRSGYNLTVDPVASGSSSRTSTSAFTSLRGHSRSASTPSASLSTFDYEDYEDDSDDSEIRFARPLASPSSTSHHHVAKDGPIDSDDEASIGSTPPPSPLIFANRSSLESTGPPTTVAFPDMEALFALHNKKRKFGRSKTVSHHPFSEFSLSGPMLRKSQPGQPGVGWSGKWNKRDMQDVIQSLRELK